MVFSSIRSLLGLANDMKKSMSYWRNFKGERIRIENVDVFQEFDDPDRRVKTGIEGTVSSVQSVPPGFLLEDAIEFYSSVRYQGRKGIGTAKGGEAPTVKRFDEIFVSFSDIQRVVFVEDDED